MTESDHLLVDELDVRCVLKQKCKEAGGALAFARSIGFEPSLIISTCNGEWAPSDRLLKHLGFERVTKYRRTVQQ